MKLFDPPSLPVKQKRLLFLLTVVLGSAALPLIATFAYAPIYPLIAMLILTVLAPLFVGLFVYKGRAAMVFIVLAAVAVLFGLAAVISEVILSQHFIAECQSHGPDWRVAFASDGAYCWAPNEVKEYTYDALLFGPIGNAASWFFLFSGIINLANLIYLPVWYMWRALRRHRKH